MVITRKSTLTGVTRSQEIPVTAEQMQAFEGGALIQNAMPNLTDDQREFILNGITPDEWDELVGEEPDDDDWLDDEPAF